MCGIAGAVGLADRPDPELIRRVLGAIEHRGPDSEGERFRTGTWLGFRRLAILDLELRANQPLVDDDTGVAMVFNGEIYNYLELRDALEARGHGFRTTGDSEVLLRGYIEWGDAVFPKCNGMWATAIDDPKRPGVRLCRDRFGEKPLYVGRAKTGSWWFASEPGALRAAGVGSGRVDLDRVAGLLVLGDIEDPSSSYFDGIEQVPPGHLATLDERGLRDREQWFDPIGLIERAWGRPAGAPDEVRETIERAVGLRLRSDVEVGTSLSGGLDSPTIVTALRTVAGASRRVHSFTASFPGSPVDEWDRASLVGKAQGLEMHRVEPTVEGFLEDLDQMVLIQGGPIEAVNIHAQWAVMREAKRAGVTVLLDGQGADETWGGYVKYVGFAVGDAVMHGRVGRAREIVSAFRDAGGLPRLDVRQAAALALPPAGRRLVLQAFSKRSAPRLGPALRDAVLVDPQGTKLGGGLLQRAAQADIARGLLPRLLRYADRNSMAFGREIRLPYLDEAVVELALRSGWSEGMAHGWTKHGLRTAFSGLLPKEIVWRREKLAYQAPSDWADSPGIRARRVDAVRDLTDAGILADGPNDHLDTVRVLSLARFLDVYGLSA